MRLVWLFLTVLGCSKPQATTAPPDASPRAPVVRPDAAAAAAADAAERRADFEKICCIQCVSASERDPSARPLSEKLCSNYDADFYGAAGVDDECRAWFKKNGFTVVDCKNRL
jgi:hypothetical protein